MKKSRTAILRQNQSFAEYIIRLQILRKQFDLDTTIEEEGIGLVAFGRVISKAVKRNAAIRDKPFRFVAGDDEFPFAHPENKPVITEDIFLSGHVDDDVKLMDNLLILKELQGLLGAKHLLALSDYVGAWLDHWQADDEIEKAIKFLQSEVGVNFNGGFELSGDKILEYMPHLNILAPNLYLAFENSSTIIYICKFGNLHLKYYDSAEQALLSPFILSKGFSKIDSCGKRIDPADFFKMLGGIVDES